MAFVGQNGCVDKKGRLAALTIVLCLYMISLLLLFTITSAAYLFAAHAVDQAIGISEVLIVVSSCVSLCYILTHSVAAGRQMQGHQQHHHSGLHTACFILIRLMVTLWFAASAVSLVVSLRQPMCGQGGPGGSYQIDRGNCVLQKSSVGASLLAFFTSCALFVSLETSDQPFESHFLGISKRLIEKDEILRSVSVNSSKESDLNKDVEKCNHQPWQPRGMFPSNHSVPFAVPALPPRTSHRPLDLGRARRASPRSYVPSATVPSLPPIETRMPLNWCWGLAPMQSAPNERTQRQIYPPALRDYPSSRPPTSSLASTQKNPIIALPKNGVSPTRSTRSIPKKSPLSTMRRVSNPDVPIYEEFAERRSQTPSKKSWTSTETLGDSSTRKELGNVKECTFAEGRTVASHVVKKSLVCAATRDEDQYHLKNNSEMPCNFGLVEVPDLAGSLRNPCVMELNDTRKDIISTILIVRAGSSA
ncbi:MAG: hypothetical protein M1812_001360 [Candelaria pacifica]|nr:MAG: hypothetical protein M1812_001360 [Candelaria pacifica]